MRAGELRHRVRIESATETQNTRGEPIQSWAEVATRWGAVEALSGRELFAAKQFASEVTHLIRLRYLAGVKEKMRAVVTGTIYDIQAAFDPDKRKRELHILALQKSSQN